MIYLIFGFGASGKGALSLIYNKRDRFYLFDDSIQVRTSALNAYLTTPNIFVLSSIGREVLSEVDTIVLSPGISIKDKRLSSFKGQIISELELAYKRAKGKIIAITGTNGKTTTTRLISHILTTAGKRNVACGNIGLPLSQVAKTRAIKVCEVSSFQLEGAKSFAPNIACLLNITPDHLDRHGSMREYRRIKYSIFSHMGKKSVAILSTTLKSPKSFQGTLLYFGGGKHSSSYIKDGFYCTSLGKERRICPMDKQKYLGIFNHENIMCAILVAKLFNIKDKYISKALSTFVMSPYRLELVYQDANLSVYDDSKATNIDATIRAVKAFDSHESISLILGGSDKDTDFDLLFTSLPQNVKTIYATGQVRDKIKSSFERSSFSATLKTFPTLKDATFDAIQTTPKGIVLLSPASASFDEFSSYKDRGEKFKQYVYLALNSKGDAAL